MFALQQTAKAILGFAGLLLPGATVVGISFQVQLIGETEQTAVFAISTTP